MKVEGLEKFPFDGAVIVAANHTTNFDVFSIQFALPNPHDTPLSLTDRLMFTLATELPESMRGVYAEVPKGFGG